jgi:hypothetical protein
MMNRSLYFFDVTQDFKPVDLVFKLQPKARNPAFAGNFCALAAEYLSVSPRYCVKLPDSFEVSAGDSCRRVKRETGTACMCAQACAAPATVCERGSVTTPLQAKRLREGDRPNPTSPETGLAR